MSKQDINPVTGKPRYKPGALIIPDEVPSPWYITSKTPPTGDASELVIAMYATAFMAVPAFVPVSVVKMNPDSYPFWRNTHEGQDYIKVEREEREQ